MAKNVSQDRVSLIIDAESEKAQQAIHELEKSSKKLREENAARLKQMVDLEKAGQKESDYYKNLQKQYNDTRKQINANSKAVAEYTKKINVNNLTMAQLRKEAKQLQRQMDNTSKSLHPEAYTELEKRLEKVKGRMSELNGKAMSLKEIFFSKNSMGFMMGSGIIGAVSALVGTLIGLISSAIGKIRELVDEGIEMAKSSDGIRHAFDQLNQPNLLDNLRKATHGTVNDIELMKAAVRAKDFRLPLDQLGKYLEFAQLKAQQTGQSVDYLTESIIMGLGRQSKQILDNLGISAAQITEEMEKGGDMATAVGRIIDQQLQETGEHYESAAEREQQAITSVQNAQRELGEQLLPLQEAGTTMWTTLQIYALKFLGTLVNVVKGAVARFTDMYNSSKTVRRGINDMVVALKTVWEVIVFVSKTAYEAVRMVGKGMVNLGKIVEGVFTKNFGMIKEGYAGLWVDTWKSFEREIGHAKAMGKGIADAFKEGFEEIENGKIVAPSVKQGKPANELDEVVVTGKRKDPTKPNPSAGKTGSSSDDQKKREADRRAIDELKRNRQEELSIEQQHFERIQSLWREQLAKKNITQQEYDTVTLSQTTEHAQCVLEIERKYAKDSESLTLNDASRKQNLVKEYQDKVRIAESNFDKARLKAFEDYQKNVQQLENAGMSAADKEKADRDAQLKVLKAYYEASLSYAKENGQSVLGIVEAYAAAIKKLNDEWAKSDSERHFRARSSAGITTIQEEKQYAIDEINSNTELSPEEKNQAIENLEREHQQRLLQIKEQYGIVSQQELFEAEMEQLAMQHEQGLLSETEYEEAKKQMKMQKWQESFDYYHGLFSNAVSALQDAEMANVDAKYDAEIEAARKAGKDTTKLEEKKAQEQLEIQKKYADVNFAIKASQIIADTATSIMKAYADLGPIAGSIAAALMGVTGIAQLVAANAEREKVKRMTLKGGSSSSSTAGARVATGKEEGGYLDVEREQDGRRYHAKYDPNRRGFVDRPTVIVGEGPAGQSKEWIASNAAVENPTVRPLLDVLDRAQRAGTIRTLDLNKIMLQQRGFAQGGSLSPSAPNAQLSTLNPQLSPALIERFVAAIELMEQQGIPATVTLDDIDRQNKLLQQSRNIGSK